jgi:hypothetical protein
MPVPERLLALFLALALAACGSSLASGPSQPKDVRAGLRITATPEPVAAGATLTYTISTTAPGAVASRLVVHLPPGVAEIEPSGASWLCSQAARDADEFQSAGHTDLDCASAAQGAMPPLTVRLKAPATAGPIRTCVAGRGASSCASSTVRP